MSNIPFVNREKELETLEREYQRSDASFVVVYGRRRIGKTALLRQFMVGKKGLYFLATQEAMHLNQRQFQQQLAKVLDAPYLSSVEQVSWELMAEEIARGSHHERLVILLDEFQYLGMVDPAFPSLFQRLWDTVLKQANVMVVLCGSLISMMESQVLNYHSPLYGRRTAQIRVRSMGLKEFGQFWDQKLSLKDMLWRYGITGGIPKYIEVFRNADQGLQLDGFWEAVRTEILNRNALLYEEPYFLLSQEVKEVGNYFSVMRAIAQGNHKAGEIARTLQIKEMNLRHYLKTLMDLEMVERQVPVTEKNPEKSKMSLYIIKDEYLRFWFRFVHPYQHELEMNLQEQVLERIKDVYVENHLSYVYETVCQQDLIHKAATQLKRYELNRFGKWWNRHQEVDIAALSESTNTLLLGECKLTEKPMDAGVLETLKNKAYEVTWKKDDRQLVYALYSFSGFSETLQNMAKTDPRLHLFSLSLHRLSPLK